MSQDTNDQNNPHPTDSHIVSPREFLKSIDHLPPDQKEKIFLAYNFSETNHNGQFRKSGDPYFTHPLAVANMVALMNLDHLSIIAALLHDVIEDTDSSKDQIKNLFGDEVAEIVDSLSKIKQIFSSHAEAQAQNLQKIILAMFKDIRVILIKLCDRLHNIKTLHYLDKPKQRRIAKETLDLYSPIAARLGMNRIKFELEEVCFKTLYPLRARILEKRFLSTLGNKQKKIQNILNHLTQALTDEKLTFTIESRTKQIYSIYQKMKNKTKNFSDVTDVFGFRIILDTVPECYQVLGIVHGLYNPLFTHFKDYIAIPKENGYQSLHTTLFGAKGIPIEVQIRTRSMDTFAREGIAGHWQYKSKQDFEFQQSKTRKWLKSVIEIQNYTSSSLEFMEKFKIDLFPNDVYVFTPTGEIIELPKGATPIDLAYAIHSNLGNESIACSIDRKLAPLDTVLQNGQTVQIIRSLEGKPNPDWLRFVVSNKARVHIRQALKTKQQVELIAIGRHSLYKNLTLYAIEPSDLTDSIKTSITKYFNQPSFEKLLAEMGTGNIFVDVVIQKILTLFPEKKITTISESSLESDTSPPIITSLENAIISYAKCCLPIPNDPIEGHVHPGKGLVIHQAQCKNIKEIKKKQAHEINVVKWSTHIDADFSTQILLTVEQKQGIISEIAVTLTKMNAGIETINVIKRESSVSFIKVFTLVKNRSHLANILHKLRETPGILTIKREKNL